MKWTKKQIDPTLVKSLMKKFNCDALSASILIRRNLFEGPDAFYSLETNSRYLSSPFRFKNMEDAVDRILNAKDEGEKVLVFGDRDVDGITATAVLYEALQDIGLDVRWQIPMGDERYGLSETAIEHFAQDDGTLIITVDCGISNFKEVAFANAHGIDVIISDHHKPQEKLPEAFTIINPQLEDSGYPLKEICGCFVAWNIVRALRFAQTELYKNSMCLLNVHPINDAYTIEVRKLFNLVEVATITEHIQAGMIDFTSTRLPQFLQGQQIFVWNESQQKKMLARVFGNGVEFNFCDLQPLVAKKYPELGSTSLLRLKDFSTIGKYIPEKNTEIDAFTNIFITFMQNSNKLFSTRERSEIQLVTLASISDLMPLRLENRMLVKLGLQAMNSNLRSGLADILAQQGMNGPQIGTHEIAWSISPVLNAAGRMGEAELAVKMLIAQDAASRNELVGQLLKLNEERKSVSERCWAEIQTACAQSFDAHNQKLVVVSSDKIERGVSGILASRAVNTFNVPSVIICEMPDGTATASCRSVPGFQILDLLTPSKELFTDYGGHDYAAGFTIEKEKLVQLSKNLQAASRYIEFEDPTRMPIEVDAELPEKYITPDVLKYIDIFEPFGEGFPELVFMSKDLKVEDALIVGKSERKHLKITLNCAGTKWSAMYWGQGELLETVRAAHSVDIVYNITRNFFRGTVSPQMIVLDLKVNQSTLQQ